MRLLLILSLILTSSCAGKRLQPVSTDTLPPAPAVQQPAPEAPKQMAPALPPIIDEECGPDG